MREVFPELKDERLYRGSDNRWNLADMESDLAIYQARLAESGTDTGAGSGLVAVPAAPGQGADSSASREARSEAQQPQTAPQQEALAPKRGPLRGMDLEPSRRLRGR
eukprot:3789612-Amphidinium_carterae.1